MATNVNFSGSLIINDAGCPCAVADEFPLQFDAGPLSFEAVFKSVSAFQFSSPSSWQSLPLADGLSTVSLLYLAAVGGTSVTLLIGKPPVWNGTGGTFPTGFVGGETFTFQLLDYHATTGGYTVEATIAVTFTSAAQTAEDCVRAINAQLALAGYPPMASVVSGQIVIRGAQPGQNKRLANSTANATVGFAGGNLGANGTGQAWILPGVFLSQFPAIPAEDFWLRGEAWLNVFVGGEAK